VALFCDRVGILFVRRHASSLSQETEQEALLFTAGPKFSNLGKLLSLNLLFAQREPGRKLS
jgi:hypothetical protein